MNKMVSAATSYEFEVTDISVSSGTPGTEITLEGDRSTTDEKIDEILFGDDSVDFDDSYSKNTWEATIEVPEYPYGSYTITVTSDLGTDATKSFKITPKLTLSKTSGKAGDTVTVKGVGYTDDDDEISIYFDSTALTTDTESDEDGTFSESVTIPSSASTGSHTIKATDSEDRSYSATFTISASPTIALSKTAGTAGSSITVTGSGFAASESGIVVTYDSMPPAGANTTTASSSGTWSLTFNIPASAGGNHVIDASGSTTTSISPRYFTITPTLSLSKNSAVVGDQINVTGSGFYSGESNITVTMDGKSISQPTTAGSTGAWTTSITIPAASAGAHNISATGSNTTTGIPSLAISIGAGISINKTTGPAGTGVTVSGAGFSAGEKTIVVTFDTTQVASNITAKADGTWTANFNVPASSGGDHSISASGVITKAVSIQSQVFTVLPSISLKSTNGAPGNSVTVNGSGFSPNQKGISVTFDGQEVANISAQASGDWTATFNIPPGAFGSHTISVAGAGIGDLSLGDLSFKVTPSATITPSTGTVGTNVTVKGFGFAPNSSIQFTYDDQDVSAGRVTTDGMGSFSKSFAIPKSIAGDHTVRTVDSQNNSAEMSFSIASNPPSVPKPESPASGKRLGFLGKITPTFTWSKSTGASVVTYTFQLDIDPEFSDPIEETDLTTPKYSLSQSEALTRGTYYWRVKAIDIASNESPWSQTQTLKSGLMPPFLFFLLLILVLAALGAAAYFLLPKFLLKRQKAQAPASPEIVIPEIVNAEYKQLEGDKKTLPWRLALPQAPQQPKGAKNLSSEDQARLRTIIEFAKSLPLPQPDSNTLWLVEMAENNTGNTASPALYNQLLKGEIQVRYEPAWMRHPTFLDLQALLEGQPIMQDLTAYVEAINQLSNNSLQILQDIYLDTTAEVTWDLVSNGGWAYISGIYSDGINWFQGKNLREPSDRDYSVKVESPAGEQPAVMGLYGDQNTAFPGLLAKAPGDTEVQQIRALHLKLRRGYRNNDKLRDLVNLISQMDVQRNRLINAFSQFSKLGS